MPHVQLRPSGVFLRVSVPQPLRLLVGTGEIVRRVRGDPKAARRTCAIVAARIVRLFEDMLSRSDLAGRSMDQDRIRNLVDR